ncbi:MAG TPA: CBS domain-containing protein [Nitrospirae bacterium]|nr:CBS domain-containing protein [Nitrospirota bacterium]
MGLYITSWWAEAGELSSYGSDKMHTGSVAAVFTQVVRHYMHGPPPAVPPDMNCGKAVRIMRELPATCVIVTSPDGKPEGILTKRDILRRITYLKDESTPVSSVMTSPLRTIRDNDYLYRGIATMNRNGLRHLPVIDHDGLLCGILHLKDTLSKSINRVVELIESLTHEETREGLKKVKEAEVEFVEALFEEHVPTPEILKLLTQINNDIYRGVQAVVQREMRDDGWGDPPVDFCMIVMGAGGRGESFLTPDQDYGFILQDYPDSQHMAVDSYFIELARRISIMLDEVGIPECKGYVMAVNPQWRKTLTQWKTQINYWLEHPSQATLRYADIFFDFRNVTGDSTLSNSLRHYITGAVSNQHVFLREMHLSQKEHGVALGLFGRLSTAHKNVLDGRIDLKYNGLLPLVESVRLMALKHGTEETATLLRMSSLNKTGFIDEVELEALRSAFNHLTFLILRQQRQDFEMGIEARASVSSQSLTKMEKNILIESLRSVSDLREKVRMDLTADVV